jgi:hypothetical protein
MAELNEINLSLEEADLDREIVEFVHEIENQYINPKGLTKPPLPGETVELISITAKKGTNDHNPDIKRKVDITRETERTDIAILDIGIGELRITTENLKQKLRPSITYRNEKSNDVLEGKEALEKAKQVLGINTTD